MAGLFSRFRSIFGSGSGNSTTVTPSTNQLIDHRIETKLPTTFSLLTSQYGFYLTILGDIDDKKPLTVPQKLVQDILEKSLAQKSYRLKSVPRLPSIIPKLLQRLRDPKSALVDYVKIINKDPAMSTSVLKLANSVYFNPVAKRVSSIETAVVKLGTEGLRSVLSAAVMQPVIERKSYYYSEFGHKLWTHSLHCAVACELIAKQRGIEPYKAYLLGLIHDIGKITIFNELSAQFEMNNSPDQPGYAAFAPMMQSTSEKLSHTVAEDWELPEELCLALKQQVNLKAGDKIDKLAHLLYQANLACEIYAIMHHDESQTDAALQALKDMNLPLNLFQQLDLVSMDL